MFDDATCFAFVRGALLSIIVVGAIVIEDRDMSTPQIKSYRFGRIVIDGRAYSKDVIILPNRVIGNWRRQEGHALRPDDLAAVFEAAPEALIVGQGAFGLMRVTHEAEQSLQAAGIELIALPTGEAVETYNRLREERAVAAALHLTC